MLAAGFLPAVHLFNTHLRPERSPMDLVVFPCRMILEELQADKRGLCDELVEKGELEQNLVCPPSIRV